MIIGMVWMLLIAGLGACGWPGPPDSIRIEAHRAGAGYWPGNSAIALEHALWADYDGVEFDLLLTADDVPVLTHDPFLDLDKCTTNLYSPLRNDVLVRDLTALELREGYLCGGQPDPDHPNAGLLSAPLMNFNEALRAIENGDPDLFVHVDVKVEEPLTASAEASARAILERWVRFDLPNPWLVSANTPEALLAFRSEGAALGLDVMTQLIVPFHPTGGSEVATALDYAIPTMLGTNELVAMAEEAEADAVAIHHELATRHSVRVARAEGLEVSLWTLNERETLLRYLDWEVDGIITDYPDDAP
jgi:glycerophosphoryl diester phosphodiesterase